MRRTGRRQKCTPRAKTGHMAQPLANTQVHRCSPQTGAAARRARNRTDGNPFVTERDGRGTVVPARRALPVCAKSGTGIQSKAFVRFGDTSLPVRNRLASRVPFHPRPLR